MFHGRKKYECGARFCAIFGAFYLIYIAFFLKCASCAAVVPFLVYIKNRIYTAFFSADIPFLVWHL